MCQEIAAMQAACTEAGMPIEPEKNEDPATTISFLGLEFDSEQMEIRLPQESFTDLKCLLASRRGKKQERKGTYCHLSASCCTPAKQ